MTDEEIHRIAKVTVHEVLQMAGFDISNPQELQRDLQFIRAWRQSSEAVKRQGLLAVVTIILGGILGLIWLAVKGGNS